MVVVQAKNSRLLLAATGMLLGFTFRNVIDTSVFLSSMSVAPLKDPSVIAATEMGNIGLEKNTGTFPTLEKLTQNPTEPIKCPPPLVPLYDRIVEPQLNDTQKIPRRIHLAWIRGYQSPYGRCLSQDQLMMVDLWKKQFPSYSIYLHDDKAVDALFDQPLEEFPELSHMMKACVKYGSAMRIDIWRQLILYYYGGFYSDMDVAPGPELTEAAVQPNDSGFSLSDAWNRLSQWMFALEAHHPISYFTMREIFKRLLEMEDVSVARLVFLTGPEALKSGYSSFMKQGTEPHKHIFDAGVHTGMLGKQFRKLEYKYVTSNKQEMVPYPRNATNATMIKRGERIEKEMNTVHWGKIVKRTSTGNGTSCWSSLYMLDNSLISLN